MEEVQFSVAGTVAGLTLRVAGAAQDGAIGPDENGPEGRISGVSGRPGLRDCVPEKALVVEVSGRGRHEEAKADPRNARSTWRVRRWVKKPEARPNDSRNGLAAGVLASTFRLRNSIAPSTRTIRALGLRHRVLPQLAALSGRRDPGRRPFLQRGGTAGRECIYCP
jgi:hypothetical protein